MNSEEMVQFTCPQCEKRLKRPASFAGRQCCCPRCSILMEIPGPLRTLAVRPVVQPVVHPVIQPVAEHYPVALPARQEQAKVPLIITVPHNLGGIQIVREELPKRIYRFIVDTIGPLTIRLCRVLAVTCIWLVFLFTPLILACVCGGPSRWGVFGFMVWYFAAVVTSILVLYRAIKKLWRVFRNWGNGHDS